MVQSSLTSDSKPEELHYLDIVNHGDDFKKIEIYRNALEWYYKALKIKPNDQDLLSKIDFCKRQLKFENKLVLIIIGIAAILICAILIF